MNIIRTFLFAFFLFCISAPSFATDKVGVDRTIDRQDIVEAEVTYKADGFINGDKKKSFIERVSTFFLKVTKKIMPRHYDKIAKRAASGDGQIAAILGLVFGVIALSFIFINYNFFSISLILAPTSVILSIIALNKINKSKERDGLMQLLAILGLIFGGVATIFIILVIGVLYLFLF